jgi:acyl-coenzyme A synthetase/AMP-(fatty) acid ligase
MKSSLLPHSPRRAGGKIMRRLLRDIADGEAVGDATTLLILR